MTVELHLGDCLEVMRTLDENSVDTCITDPPYELGFMGKRWDSSGVAFQVATWEAVYRVLKPGALLLAFGGTRTYHRMVCAIEDAGFEIRDTIAWVYGSGFPKSLDIGKGIDKQAGVERERLGYSIRIGDKKPYPKNTSENGNNYIIGDSNGGYQTTKPITAPSTPEAQLWNGWGTALKPAWEIICVASKPEHTFQERGIIVESLNRLEGRLWSLLPASIAEKNFGLSRKEYEGACGSAQWSADEKQRTLEGLLGQMDMSQLESAAITSLNTVSLWKSILAEALSLLNTCTTETESSLITDLKILSYSLSQLTLQDIIKALTYQRGQPSNALTVGNLFYAVKTKLNYTQELSAQENVTSRGNQKDLRPELTPIVVAMKPIDGTFVNNALTWGVAGLWIDGGRISANEHEPNARDSKGGKAGTSWFTGDIDNGEWNGNQGRFPANFIHDGSDEVLAAFPNVKTGGNYCKTDCGDSMFGKRKVNTVMNTDNSNGSASRFFYCAKASRSERNAGLEGMEEHRIHTFQTGNGASGKPSSISAGRNTVYQNNHPTVKPISLMRYLVRLTSTPTGGVVIDPFMGSGTTGCACAMEGRDFIGIEREQDYIEIAEKRIEHWALQPIQLELD